MSVPLIQLQCSAWTVDWQYPVDRRLICFMGWQNCKLCKRSLILLFILKRYTECKTHKDLTVNVTESFEMCGQKCNQFYVSLLKVFVAYEFLYFLCYWQWIYAVIESFSNPMEPSHKITVVKNKEEKCIFYGLRWGIASLCCDHSGDGSLLLQKLQNMIIKSMKLTIISIDKEIFYKY